MTQPHADFYLDRCPAPDVIAGRVRSDGLVVIANYLDAAELSIIQAEFHRAYQPEHAADFYHDRVGCHDLRIARANLRSDRFPAVASLFSASFMSEVSRSFYEPDDFSFNEEIFICHHHPTVAPVGQLPYVLHFDKTQTLKFFLYVEKTGVAQGALEVVPGSHQDNRESRLRDVRRGRALSQMQNVIDAPASKPIPVVADAGALVVFDTDISHRAGHVHPGNDRKVIRGHTRRLVPAEAAHAAAHPHWLTRLGRRLGLSTVEHG